MPEPYNKSTHSPWGLFRGDDIYWLGMARGESEAWTIGLGWPDQEEIAAAKTRGIYASPVGLSAACQIGTVMTEADKDRNRRINKLSLDLWNVVQCDDREKTSKGNQVWDLLDRFDKEVRAAAIQAQ